MYCHANTPLDTLYIIYTETHFILETVLQGRHRYYSNLWERKPRQSKFLAEGQLVSGTVWFQILCVGPQFYTASRVSVAEYAPLLFHMK